MKIKGYKAFHKDMTDHRGKHYVEGEVYSMKDPSKLEREEGFHFSKRLEDSLRGYHGIEEDIVVAEVTSLGLVRRDQDDEYGYYDMYYTNSIRIDRVLTREEILAIFLKMEPNERVERFLKSYKLTEPEIEIFREKMVDNREVPIITYKRDGSIEKKDQLPIGIKRIDQAISYYQENKKEAYKQDTPKQKLK